MIRLHERGGNSPTPTLVTQSAAPTGQADRRTTDRPGLDRERFIPYFQ